MSVPGSFEILFRCTDRDSHSSRVLDRVGLKPDTGKPDTLTADEWDMTRLTTFIWHDTKRGGGIRNGTPHGELLLEEGVYVWRFHCPTCRRDLQVKYGTLIRVMNQLHAAGVSSVDISKLPATLVSS